ncbi:MAG TPA: DUF433 domain-containing protein [Bryobacteraceae bacterium]|nr:DUF433 domain-containing protein [Bryobacteraceae bacterium]
MSGNSNSTQLDRLRELVTSDPEMMCGTPVFQGDAYSVDLIADMLAQGATVEEILEGYPTLAKETIAMAPFCARAFPVRKNANRTPWSGKKPKAEGSFRLSDLLGNAR